MKVNETILSWMRPAMFTAALVAGVTGCAMHEPLQEKRLQDEANNPRVSIVLLHFRSHQVPPIPKGFSEGINRLYLRWVFAVANESTGWTFRRLDEFSMIFRTNDVSMEADPQSNETGWVTFLAPPGLSYIAITTYATALGTNCAGQDLVAKPFSDHISVEHSAARPKFGSRIMDFIDAPRFAVQVSGPRSLVYVGTVVRNIRCAQDEGPSCSCPYDLTVVDESETARKFVSRYQRNFPVVSPMQTRLLTIPQSRTIEIRGDLVGPDSSR
jgi:hypothetical protein